MSSRRDFPWGRWIRVSVAHHYLGADRRWFDHNIKPQLTVIKVSKQARAFIRAEIDEAAAAVETLFRDGRPSLEKGEYARVEREQAASQPMPKATKSSTSKSMRKNGSRSASSESPSHTNVDRVLESLSAKLRSDT
jgi:hypothetical protein